MSRPLINPEMVLLQEETNYLDMGIPLGGSVVMDWNGMIVLIYHSNKPGVGYFTTDVSDLPETVIAELAKKSEVHGMLYFLPGEIQNTLESYTETVIDAGFAAGEMAGEVAKKVANMAKEVLQSGLLGQMFKPPGGWLGDLTIPLALAVLGLFLVLKIKG